MGTQTMEENNAKSKGWGFLRKKLKHVAKIQEPPLIDPIETFITVETDNETIGEAFRLCDELSKVDRSLSSAKDKYQMTEKKALTKPNGFYENKLELLTETIIFHERQQQIKQRQLCSITRVICVLFFFFKNANFKIFILLEYDGRRDCRFQ